MIRAARHTIYVENQYFTSAKVGDALCERLSSASCPEIVVVLSYECHGWLEENVMGVLRARLLQRLRAADRHGKLHVYSPITADGRALTVHSKVMIVDDVAARIGSSNLNNRSMGLDTECDALVEARGSDDVRTAIARFRDRLPVSAKTPVVSLGEGSTPLLSAPRLADSAGIRELWLKWEASNPTGSYKDRGMTVAVSKALEQGAEAVLCASTGNTAGSAAAYDMKMRVLRLRATQRARSQRSIRPCGPDRPSPSEGRADEVREAPLEVAAHACRAGGDRQ